jgi:site-specific DNA-methyltransferase (adenine-specific)
MNQEPHTLQGWVDVRGRCKLIKNGNSLELLKSIPDNSVDAIITDPPYQLASIQRRFGSKNSAEAQYGTDGAFRRVSRGFMGKEWDVLPSVELLRECLRVMKHGAFSFWMMTPRQDSQLEFLFRLREAGFNIGFTSMYHTYSSGFPKAQSTSRAIDRNLLNEGNKHLQQFVYETVFKSMGIPFKVFQSLLENISIGEVGYKREIIGQKKLNQKDKKIYTPNTYKGLQGSKTFEKNPSMSFISAPASQEAEQFSGAYTFSPKPAVEVILVAGKPLSEKTYADQALKNGKGVVYFDDCRIPYEGSGSIASNPLLRKSEGARIYHGIDKNPTSYALKKEVGEMNINSNGRFPANLLVSDDVLNDGRVTYSSPVGFENVGWKHSGNTKDKMTKLEWQQEFNDSGSFSRYFDLDAWYEKNVESLPDYVQRVFPFLIVSKPSPSEKNKGIEGREEQTVDDGRNKSIDNPFQRGETLRKNIHPTSKPVKLMSYLVTLSTRQGDTVLDPFMGSGTTGVASKMLGREFIGFELQKEYFEIAEDRIKSEPSQSRLSGWGA